MAARDMQAGQLLFVENPLAIAHVDSNQLGFQIDMQSRRMTQASQSDLIVNLANIGLKNPRSLQQMYALYDGTKQSLQSTPDIHLFDSTGAGFQGPSLAIDTAKISNIVRINAVGSGCAKDQESQQAQVDLFIQDENPAGLHCIHCCPW